MKAFVAFGATVCGVEIGLADGAVVGLVAGFGDGLFCLSCDSVFAGFDASSFFCCL